MGFMFSLFVKTMLLQLMFISILVIYELLHFHSWCGWIFLKFCLDY